MPLCASCETIKPSDDFSVGQLVFIEDFNRGSCRDCWRKYRIARGVQRPPGWIRKTADMAAYQREYRAANRDRMRELEQRWRENNPEKERAAARRKYVAKRLRLDPNWQPKVPFSKDEKAELKRARNRRKYYRAKETNPQRHAAKLAVKTAVAMGVLVRQPCAECGNPKAEGHHPDYAKPLDVIWLCRAHHIALHRALAKTKLAN